MELKDGENRKTKVNKGSKNSKSKSNLRSLGDVPVSSSEHGNYPIGIGGTYSNQSDTTASGKQRLDEISGKLISQLIEETEKQLAYHQQQVESLQTRLQELKEIYDVENNSEPQ